MQSLADRLRAQFDEAVNRDRRDMPPPPARRPASAPGAAGAGDDADADAMDIDAHQPAPAVAAAPARDMVDPVFSSSTANSNFFTPLRGVFDARNQEDMADLVEMASRTPVHCFFCECGGSNVNLESNLGTWVVGYNLIVNYLRNNWAIRQDVAVANEVVRLYNVHIRDPCVAANGGVAPATLYQLTVKDVLVHIREHTRHPMVTQIFLMDTLKHLIVGLSGRVFVDGVPDVKVATVLLSALQKMDHMNEKRWSLFDKETDFILDPVRVNNVANMQRLENLQLRTADALGGATATGSTASMAAAAALTSRPQFGHPVYQQSRKRPRSDSMNEAASADESDVALAEL